MLTCHHEWGSGPSAPSHHHDCRTASVIEVEARTPAGRYVGANAFSAQDPSTSSSHGDESLQRCCGVYSALEHGTWSSSLEATEHPSLHGAEDFSIKRCLWDRVKTSVVRALMMNQAMNNKAIQLHPYILVSFRANFVRPFFGNGPLYRRYELRFIASSIRF